MEPCAKHSKQVDFCISFGLALVLFALLSGLTDFWYPGGVRLFPSGSFGVVPGALLAAGAACWAYRRSYRVQADVFAVALVFTLLFFSDWLGRGYNFFQAPAIRGEVLLCALLAYWLIRLQCIEKAWRWVLAGTIAASLYCFHLASAGRLLFSDDHSTFLYRLILLRENFPFVPFFNPQWNAGHDARDTFATGVLNLFILSQPWIYLVNIEVLYTLLVVVLLLIVFPLTVYYAARIMSLRSSVAALAGILVLATGLHWYRWSLKYGTMGFVIGAIFLPLLVTLAAKLLDRGVVAKRYGFLFILTTTLALCWPFYGVVLLPIFASLLYCFFGSFISIQDARKIRFWRLLIVGAILCLINFPVLLTFVGTSSLGNFIHNQAATESDIAVPASAIEHADEAAPSRRYRHAAGSIDGRQTLAILRSIAFSSNPLILFMGLAGLCMLTGWYRRLLLLQIAWCFLLGAVLYPLKPQLELDRLLVLVYVFLAIPAAVALDSLCRSAMAQERRGVQAVTALLLGFVFTGSLVLFSIVRNRTVEQYYFADSMVRDFQDFLAQYETDGRIIFSGCILHEFAGGHLAPLAFQTKIPMVASSQAHTLWWYKDVIPSSFLKRGDAGKEAYFDLYNVSDVFAHEKKWKRYFRQRKETYQLVWQGHGFELFKRLQYKPNYFLAGSGTVLSQQTNGFRVRLESPNAVLKFRYTPALEVAGCTVYPHRVYDEVDFIGLKNCRMETPLLVQAKPPWRQLFLKDRKSIG